MCVCRPPRFEVGIYIGKPQTRKLSPIRWLQMLLVAVVLPRLEPRRCFWPPLAFGSFCCLKLPSPIACVWSLSLLVAHISDWIYPVSGPRHDLLRQVGLDAAGNLSVCIPCNQQFESFMLRQAFTKRLPEN